MRPAIFSLVFALAIFVASLAKADNAVLGPYYANGVGVTHEIALANAIDIMNGHVQHLVNTNPPNYLFGASIAATSCDGDVFTITYYIFVTDESGPPV